MEAGVCQFRKRDSILDKENFFDNKALTHTFAPDKDIPTLETSRLQWFALILSSFNYDIAYLKSNEYHADILSRLSIPEFDEFVEKSAAPLKVLII